MPDETLTDVDESSDGIDDAALAGLSEYSATGGGGQPPHFPRMGHDAHDEPEPPEADSFRELYRYSLGRATQDAHSDEEDWASEEGPLHVVAAPKASRKQR